MQEDAALTAIRNGVVDPSGAIVIWNVADRPLLQRITEFDIPRSPDLLPVRRIGTYQGAQSRMGWFATVRDGHAIYLESESRTEHHWLRALDMEPSVTWLQTQPFLLVWPTSVGAVIHTPDILALQFGQPRVVDVKPEAHRTDYDDAIFDLTGRTLARASVTFHVAGSSARQGEINHIAARRWKRRNPSLTHLVELVEAKRPRTAHHLFTLCGGHQRGIAVMYQLRANARCWFDLNVALHRATPITWPDETGALSVPQEVD